MIRGLLFGSGVLFGSGGSGGDHCDLELAVEVGRRRKEEEGGGRRSRADIKSNNPRLTGGEKMVEHIKIGSCKSKTMERN